MRSGELSILYEDNHLIAVNKPSGVLVQGDETGDKPLVETCKEYLAVKYEKPGAVFLGVVHRLDRPVSGIVVFARTSKALSRMNALFRNKETRKTYLAMVSHPPVSEEDTLVHWLLKDEKKNKTTSFRKETAGARRSELRYRVMGSSGNKFLLEVNPITGRSHQIRAQLAAIGCPIAGDVKYGAKEPADDGSIALHAFRLEFEHPVKKETVVLQAQPPGSLLWGSFSFLLNQGQSIR
jgi:23S rRNA pseudouridine1911/1915/1917 synthase